MFIIAIMIISVSASYAENRSPEKGEILVFEPLKIDFGILNNSEINTREIKLKNTGTSVIKWVARASDSWLNLDKRSGVIEENTTENISVMMNSEILPEGRHESKVTVTSTSGTISIPVSVNVLNEKQDESGLKLENIFLKAESEFLNVGKKMFFKALGKYSDGSMKDLTKDVKWISTDKRIGQFTSPGALNGETVGDIKVYVIFGELRSPAVTISIESVEGPILKVSPTEFVLGNIEKDTKKDVSVTIRNRGEAELEWQAISKVPWLTLSRKLSDEDFEIWDIVNYQNSLSGVGKAEIVIKIDTENMTEGEYEGEILINSNGGEEKIFLSMNIVTLKSLSISPVSIKIGVGQKRTFRVIGIWSDGSRTDLSKDSEGEWVSSDPDVGTVLSRKSVFLSQKTGRVQIFRIRGDMVSNSAVVEVEKFISQPVLLVSPREIDLESIGLGESARVAYSLQNVGSGKLLWWSKGPEGWVSFEERSLEGTIDDDMRYLRLSIEIQTGESEDYSTYKGLYPVIIKIGTSKSYVSYKKELPLGNYRERMILTSNGGTRNIFFKFGITEMLSRPRLDIRPQGIDFGAIEPGKKIMRKLEVKNTGRGILSWIAKLQGRRSLFDGVVLKKGKYVSFMNENIAGMNSYEVPAPLLEDVEITGSWAENEGYPVSRYANDRLTYKFNGTGIAIFVTKEEEGGTISVSVDEKDIGSFDCKSLKKERVEFPIVTKLAEGDHMLALKNMGGRVTLEGVRIYSNELIAGRSGWIRLFPDRGTTKREIDYINVTIDSSNLVPGSYCENVLFYSDGGNKVAELSLEIEDLNTSKLIDIYRYVKGDDNILTAETETVEKGYKREKKLAFKLFRDGTPGTIKFYEWYNPAKGDHFYSSDRSGGGKSLAGYEFVGSIGNIATVKLSDTRELFRWFNADKGTHFYTTDPKGGGRSDDGYKYDGISGYVR